MIGIETEYGIYVEDKDAGHLVDESASLVAAFPGRSARGWDYQRERPRRDMRGFTVDALSIDPHDAQFERAGLPHSTSADARNDRVLPNGARLYNDHGHPEYSTPECVTLRSLVAHDRAGERIMQACAEARMRQMDNKRLVAMYKNNTDGHGASYGTHESFLIARALPFDDLLAGILPFLVTRQLFAGAGKVGIEAGAATGAPATGDVFQLSQRADFFTTVASVDTLYNRPIVNTRDEPHTDPKKYRRFHVICGDANLMETATFLKLGTTLLILRLLERGWRPDERLTLRDPVRAIQQISRDQTFQWNVERAGGGTISAMEIQTAYLAVANNQLRGLSGETDLVLDIWESTLAMLGEVQHSQNPRLAADALDWAAKYALLADYKEAENIKTWNDPALLSFDLEYHNVDPDAGLYYALEQEGRARRIVTDAEIEQAMQNAPAESVRPLIRGLAVQRFGPMLRELSWGRFVMDDGQQSTVVRLPDVVDDEDDTRALTDALGTTTTAGAFAALVADFAAKHGTSAPETVTQDETGGAKQVAITANV